jgi:diguanylate cyclase (GGDEF)-like protein
LRNRKKWKSFMPGAFEVLLQRFLCLGTRSLPDDLAAQVRAAQLSAVLNYTPWMMLANIANAGAVMLAFAREPHRMWAFGWGATVVCVAVFVLWKWWRHRRKPKPTAVSLRAIRRSVANSALLGGMWGVLAPLLYPFGDANSKLVLICVLAGMLCGSGFALSTVPAAAITFAGAVALGVVGALLLTPSMASALIFMMSLIYAGIIFRSSISLSKLLTDRIVSDLRAREQRDVISLLLNDFTENASDWLWAVDSELRLTQVSSRLSDMLGKPASWFVGKHVSDCIPLLKPRDCSADEADAVNGLKLALARRKPFRDMLAPVEVEGRKLLWSFTAKPVFRDGGKFDGYRGVGRDVTAEQAAKANIEHLAKYDSLTNLPNRVLFREDLERALSRLRRHGERFAVLLLDLDHFKVINDTQGHPEGDLLLCKVGDRLRLALRDIDTVSRLGGDEFAIILSAVERPQEAANLAARLTQELSEPFQLTATEAIVGVSIGIAVADTGDMDVDTLLRHADLALYRSKNDGRGMFHFFEEEMDAAARRRHKLEKDLRGGLARGELELHFQPLVDANTQQVVAFEALMRWNHASFGQLSPAEFIPLAEEVGLIQPLGAWALRRACEEAMNWPEHIRVAVNLSPVQFRLPSLFLHVRNALQETGLSAGRLELEITESLLLDASQNVEATLAALRNLGVRISLDDFGTGYSSLSYLRRFRFDKIKIDRTFVRDIETEPECQAIIDALIKLARDLDMSLVVEGVETESQLALLRARGCTEVQGYLIARPSPANQLAGFLKLADAHAESGAA